VPRLEPLEGRLAPAVLTVNTLADETSPDQFLSLREAVHVVDTGSTAGLSAAEKAQIAGPLGSNDKIEFAPGLQGTILLTNPGGELSITRNVAVLGPGINLLTISGNAATRVFAIDPGVKAALEHLTIANGKSIGVGGGIDNEGTLNVSDCALADNQAVGIPGGSALGGAIYNGADAWLTLRGSTVAGNSATGDSNLGVGGGLCNLGTALITRSTFTNDRAVGGDALNNAPAGDGYGGAIANVGPQDLRSTAMLQVQRSTFSANEAAGGTAGPGSAGGNAFGGAIANCARLFSSRPFGSQGSALLSVSGCDLFGNDGLGGATGSSGSSGGQAEGGGIFNDYHCTIHGGALQTNRALGGLAAMGLGGGICNLGQATIGAGAALAGNWAIGGDSFANASAVAARGMGGGIYSQGASAFVQVSDSLLTSNGAAGGNSINRVGPGADGAGGGIANVAGMVVVSYSLIDLNQAIGGAGGGGNGTAGGPRSDGGAGMGGGIANAAGGTLDVGYSSIDFNQAIGGPGLGGNGRLAGGDNGGDGAGGGIATGPAAATRIFICDVSGNVARGGDASGPLGGNGGNGLGGGLATVGGFTSVTSSDVGDNTAVGGNSSGFGGAGGNGWGGGIFNDATGNELLQSDLIYGNAALEGIATGGGGSNGTGVGGGLYNLGSSLSFSVFIFNNHASTSHDDVFP
jgi:hypothetical protein